MRIWHQGFIDLSTVPAYEPALQRHFAAVCRPDTEVVVHGMPAGIYTGTSPAEVARHAYISGLYTNQLTNNALQAEHEGYDAMLIGIIQSIGLRESRTIVDIPVTGYGESAMHLACMLGRKFSILAFNRDLFDQLEDDIRLFGLESRAAPMQLLELDYAAVSRGFDEPGPLVAAFEAGARRAIAAGADVLIPGQMILAEILWQNGAHRIDGVPVIDALGVTAKMAETFVDLARVSNLTHSRRGFWGARPPEDLIATARRHYLRNSDA